MYLHWSSYKIRAFLSDFNEKWTGSADCSEDSNRQFQENPSPATWIDPCGRTDGRRDEANSRCRNRFANVPKSKPRGMNFVNTSPAIQNLSACNTTYSSTSTAKIFKPQSCTNSHVCNRRLDAAGVRPYTSSRLNSWFNEGECDVSGKWLYTALNNQTEHTCAGDQHLILALKDTRLSYQVYLAWGKPISLH